VCCVWFIYVFLKTKTKKTEHYIFLSKSQGYELRHHSKKGENIEVGNKKLYKQTLNYLQDIG
jgi:hypothetical protein